MLVLSRATSNTTVASLVSAWQKGKVGRLGTSTVADDEVTATACKFGCPSVQEARSLTGCTEPYFAKDTV